MFVLVVQSGKHAGRRVKLLPGETIVGRDEEAKLRVASSEVSRHHCKIIATPEEVRVEDMESRNGTFVDGAPISGSAVLHPGSTLTVGPMTFRLEGGTPTPRKLVDLPGSRESEERAKQGLSDDDIASLLSDDFGAVSASDTTVHGDDSAHLIPQYSPPSAPKQAPKRDFRSLAEEAREIIRLHFESLKGSGSAGRD